MGKYFNSPRGYLYRGLLLIGNQEVTDQIFHKTVAERDPEGLQLALRYTVSPEMKEEAMATLISTWPTRTPKENRAILALIKDNMADGIDILRERFRRIQKNAPNLIEKHLSDLQELLFPKNDSPSTVLTSQPLSSLVSVKTKPSVHKKRTQPERQSTPTPKEEPLSKEQRQQMIDSLIQDESKSPTSPHVTIPSEKEKKRKKKKAFTPDPLTRPSEGGGLKAYLDTGFAPPPKIKIPAGQKFYTPSMTTTQPTPFTAPKKVTSPLTQRIQKPIITSPPPKPSPSSYQANHRLNRSKLPPHAKQVGPAIFNLGYSKSFLPLPSPTLSSDSSVAIASTNSSFEENRLRLLERSYSTGNLQLPASTNSFFEENGPRFLEKSYSTGNLRLPPEDY